MNNILVLDDSQELLEMFNLVLTMRGYNVITVNNEVDLYKSLKSFVPDLMLIDVHLGSTDGKKLCKELKAASAFKNIPVLLMSSSETNLKDYKDCLANDIIAKPFELESLMAKIKELIVTDGSK